VEKVGYVDVPPNRRRGGDLRVLLSPRTVGSTAGFLGAGTLGVGEYVAEHYHPYSEEYLYVVHGALTLHVEGERLTVAAGESAMVPTGKRHRLVNDGTEELFAVFFLGPLAPRPELGHVDTEPLVHPELPPPAVGGTR
jgi:putative monooxygenase